jgi:hypothetical protein
VLPRSSHGSLRKLLSTREDPFPGEIVTAWDGEENLVVSSKSVSMEPKQVRVLGRPLSKQNQDVLSTPQQRSKSVGIVTLKTESSLYPICGDEEYNTGFKRKPLPSAYIEQKSRSPLSTRGKAGSYQTTHSSTSMPAINGIEEIHQILTNPTTVMSGARPTTQPLPISANTPILLPISTIKSTAKAATPILATPNLSKYLTACPSSRTKTHSQQTLNVLRQFYLGRRRN